jgi:hypothetical protein
MGMRLSLALGHVCTFNQIWDIGLDLIPGAGNEPDDILICISYLPDPIIAKEWNRYRHRTLRGIDDLHPAPG